MTDIDTSTPARAPEPAEPEAGSAFISYLPVILWQRRWWIIVPFVLATLIALVVAFVAKPIYRSSATVLVESPELPPELVSSSVTSIIDQRVAKIRQRVLSRPDLIALIQRNNLYAEERRTRPLSAIVEEMRKATNVDAISANIQQGRANVSNTIAFTMSFDYRDPAKAQLVTQQFVNRFLELDSTSQTEQAINAAGFLNQQAEAIRKQIQQIDDQVTQIKTANGAVLASGMMGRPMVDPSTIDAQIQALQMQNTQLSSQQSGGGSALGAAQRALADALARYSDDHPDVKLARQRVEAAKREGGGTTFEQQQISANRARISALLSERGRAVGQINSSFAAQARAPAITAQVDQLENRAEGLRAQYASISNKLLSAQSSARMEQEQKGERLTVADPPVVPDKPMWPNRPLLILAGIAGGLGLGLALALALEVMRRPIRGTGAVQEVLGTPPLVVVPVLRDTPSLIQRIIHRLRREPAR